MTQDVEVGVGDEETDDRLVTASVAGTMLGREARRLGDVAKGVQFERRRRALDRGLCGMVMKMLGCCLPLLLVHIL